MEGNICDPKIPEGEKMVMGPVKETEYWPLPICLGTYPVWIAKALRWYFKRSKGFNCIIVLRGRKPKAKYGSWKQFPYGTPLGKSKTCAIYLEAKRKKFEHIVYKPIKLSNLRVWNP